MATKKKAPAGRTAKKKASAKKKATAKAAAPKRAKPVVNKGVAKKKRAAKKSITKASPAKKSPAKTSPAKKSATKKSATKKSATKKSAAKKSATKKSAVKRAHAANGAPELALEALRLSTELPASPRQIFDAWLDASTHAAMTGGAATSDPRVHGSFTAWGGYISGVYLALDAPAQSPARARIVMAWRTSEFSDDDAHSLVSLSAEAFADGSLVLLEHTAIPVGQAARYRTGWRDHYFEPMRDYFTSVRASAP